MSTLNVANISDDQSTLTGSNTNPNDKLNTNTTVDTKFVTNGCAKAFGTCKADGSISENSGATLNISSTSNAGTGTYVYSFANHMNTTYVAVSDASSTNTRNAYIKGRGAANTQIFVKTSEAVLIDCATTLIVMGDLA